MRLNGSGDPTVFHGVPMTQTVRSSILERFLVHRHHEIRLVSRPAQRLYPDRHDCWVHKHWSCKAAAAAETSMASSKATVAQQRDHPAMLDALVDEGADRLGLATVFRWPEAFGSRAVSILGV